MGQETCLSSHNEDFVKQKQEKQQLKQQEKKSKSGVGGHQSKSSTLTSSDCCIMDFLKILKEQEGSKFLALIFYPKLFLF